VSIGLFCRPLLAKNPNFCRFLDFGIERCRQLANLSDKVEHGCTTTNLSLYNGIKIVSVLQRLHCEICAQSLTFISVTNRQTDEQTDIQTKNSMFWPPRRRVKSEPYQTWYGDRGPRARSCTSKTFGCLMHSFAAKGHSKIVTLFWVFWIPSPRCHTLSHLTVSPLQLCHNKTTTPLQSMQQMSQGYATFQVRVYTEQQNCIYQPMLSIDCPVCKTKYVKQQMGHKQ